MARMIEEVVVIKVAKLVKDNDSADTILTSDIGTALEQVVQELVGEGVLVEIEQVGS
jgi:hypothetical protein